MKKPLGYFVVEDPVYQVVELPQEVRFIDDKVLISSVPKYAQNNSEEFVVNILNVNGSYTQVKIVRVNNGFIGPQGEYYTEFPRVDQLKIMYGK